MPKIKFIFEETWKEGVQTFHNKKSLVREVSTDMYFAILKGFPFEYKCGRIELSVKDESLALETGHFDRKNQVRVIPNCIRFLHKPVVNEPSLFDILNDDRLLEEREAENIRKREEEEALNELYAYDSDEPWWNR